MEEKKDSEEPLLSKYSSTRSTTTITMSSRKRRRMPSGRGDDDHDESIRSLQNPNKNVTNGQQQCSEKDDQASLPTTATIARIAKQHQLGESSCMNDENEMDNNDDDKLKDENDLYNMLDLGDLVTNADRNLVSDVIFLVMSQLQIYHHHHRTTKPPSSVQQQNQQQNQRHHSPRHADSTSAARETMIGLQCQHCCKQQEQPWRKRRRNVRRSATTTTTTTTTETLKKQNSILAGYTYFPTSSVHLSQISFLYTIIHHFITQCPYCPSEVRVAIQKALLRQNQTKYPQNCSNNNNTTTTTTSQPPISPQQKHHHHQHQEQQQCRKHNLFFERIWSRMHNHNQDETSIVTSPSLRSNMSSPSSLSTTATTLLFRSSPIRHNKLLAKLGQHPYPRRILIPILEGCTSGMELALITTTLVKFRAEIVLVAATATDVGTDRTTTTTNNSHNEIATNRTSEQRQKRKNPRVEGSDNKIRVKLKEGHYGSVPMTLETAMAICKDDEWDAIIIPTRSGDDGILEKPSFSQDLIRLLRYHHMLEKPIGVVGTSSSSPKTTFESFSALLKLNQTSPPSSCATAPIAIGNTASQAPIVSKKKSSSPSKQHDSSSTTTGIFVQSNIVTSMGMGIAQLLALQIGEMLYNTEMADCIAKEMLVSRPVRDEGHRRNRQKRRKQQLVGDNATATTSSSSSSYNHTNDNNRQRSAESLKRMDSSPFTERISTTTESTTSAADNNHLERSGTKVDLSTKDQSITDQNVGMTSPPGEKGTPIIVIDESSTMDTNPESNKTEHQTETDQNVSMTSPESNKEEDQTENDQNVSMTSPPVEKDTPNIVVDESSTMDTNPESNKKDQGDTSEEKQEDNNSEAPPPPVTDAATSTVQTAENSQSSTPVPDTSDSKVDGQNASLPSLDWNDMFKQLEKYGDCSVSKLCQKDPVLGKWASDQRIHKESLPYYCIKRLDNMGFQWSDSEREGNFSEDDDHDDVSVIEESKNGTPQNGRSGKNKYIREKKNAQRNGQKTCKNAPNATNRKRKESLPEKREQYLRVRSLSEGGVTTQHHSDGKQKQKHQSPQPCSLHQEDNSKRKRIHSKLFDEIIWKRLVENCGWRLEIGSRPNDLYFFPPGVERGKGFRNRRDFFDSKTDVLRYVEKSDDPTIKVALQCYLTEAEEKEKTRCKKKPKNGVKRHLNGTTTTPAPKSKTPKWTSKKS